MTILIFANFWKLVEKYGNEKRKLKKRRRQRLGFRDGLIIPCSKACTPIWLSCLQFYMKYDRFILGLKRYKSFSNLKILQNLFKLYSFKRKKIFKKEKILFYEKLWVFNLRIVVRDVAIDFTVDWGKQIAAEVLLCEKLSRVETLGVNWFLSWCYSRCQNGPKGKDLGGVEHPHDAFSFIVFLVVFCIAELISKTLLKRISKLTTPRKGWDKGF